MQQLNEWIASVPLEVLRTQWESVSNTKNSEEDWRRDFEPDAQIEKAPTVKKNKKLLRSEDFLILMQKFASTRAPESSEEEIEWASAAVDLFSQIDVRREGELSWNDFANYILGLELPSTKPTCGDCATTPSWTLAGVARSRSYKRAILPERFSDTTKEFASQGIRSISYLGAPVDRVLAIPNLKSECVLIIAPQVNISSGPRIAATLRHHTAYRPHTVLNAIGIPDVHLVLTSSVEPAAISQDNTSFFTLWLLPNTTFQAKKNADQKKKHAHLLPILITRLAVPEPQNILFYSKCTRLIYSGGDASGFFYEWQLDSSEKRGEINLIRSLRKLRLHTFGITCIQEIPRKDATNLLLTGSSEGFISVWDPEEWQQQSTKFSLLQSAASESCTSSNSYTLDTSTNEKSCTTQRKYNYVPLVELCAQATGPGKLVLSEFHRFLFAVGRSDARELPRSPRAILVWRINTELANNVTPTSYRALKKHVHFITEIREVPTESHLITADCSGLVVVWHLPSLEIHQQLLLDGSSNCGKLSLPIRFVPLPFTCTANCFLENEGAKEEAARQEYKDKVVSKILTNLLIATDRLTMYCCQLDIIKDPLVLVHYDTSASTIILVSTRRVSVWDAKNGELKSQSEVSSLLAAAQTTPVTCESLEKSEKLSTSLEIIAACISANGRKLVLGDDRGGLHTCVLARNGSAPYRSKGLDPHDGPLTSLNFLNCNAVLSSGLDGVFGIHDECDPTGFRSATSGLPERRVRIRDVHFFASSKSTQENEPQSTHRDINPFGKAKPSIQKSLMSTSQLQSGASSSRQLSHEEKLLCASSSSEIEDLGVEETRFEVLYAAADLHLNLVATLVHENGHKSPQLCIWDFEMFSLVGTCVLSTDDGSIKERVTSLSFLSPYPLLLASSMTGRIHLWKVPECTYIRSLETIQSNTFVTAAQQGSGPDTTPCSKPVGLTVMSSHVVPDQNRELVAKVCAGSDDGNVFFWGFKVEFFNSLDCTQVLPFRRITYNPRRHHHRQIDWTELERSHRLAVNLMTKNRNRPFTDSGMSAYAFRTWIAHEEEAEITCIQLIPQDAILTAAYDGLARVWTCEGALVGQLDINAPLGVPDIESRAAREYVPWKFQTADAGKDNNEDTGIRALLSEAKRRATGSQSESESSKINEQWKKLETIDQASFHVKLAQNDVESRSWESIFTSLTDLEKREAKLNKDGAIHHRQRQEEGRYASWKLKKQKRRCHSPSSVPIRSTSEGSLPRITSHLTKSLGRR